MKRVVSFVGGIVLGAFVFGCLGAFFGYELAKSDEPALVVHNASSVTISTLKVATDVGESYDLTDLAPRKTRRMKISGRDKALWIIASTAAAKTLTSEKTYMSSDGILFAIIYDDSIVFAYESI